MSQAATIDLRQAGRAYNRPKAAQRWGTVIGGSALAVYGLTRRSPWGVAMAATGGALAYLGARSKQMREEAVAHGSVLLNCSTEEAYRFWRNFENLPRFMRHIDSVRTIGEGRSEWVALGPMGTRIGWKAEISSERENQFIAWKSLPGSDVNVEGSVEFQPARGNRGTMVTAIMRFRSPSAAFGTAAAKLLGKDPEFLMRQDLRRFKALIETGELPTIDGQSHGPRTAMAAMARMASPDQPLVGRSFEEQRRVS